MIKLIAFDLDGTLTQHKTKLDDKNRAVLNRLAEKYKLCFVPLQEKFNEACADGTQDIGALTAFIPPPQVTRL